MMISSFDNTFPLQATVVKFTPRPTNAAFVHTAELTNHSCTMDQPFESSDSISECFSTSSLSTVENDDSSTNLEEMSFPKRVGLPAGRETISRKLSVRARPDPRLLEEDSYHSYPKNELRNASRLITSSVERLNYRNAVSLTDNTDINVIPHEYPDTTTVQHLVNKETSQMSSSESVLSHGSSSLSRCSSTSQTRNKELLTKSSLDAEEPTAGLNLIVRVILYIREIFPLTSIKRINPSHIRQDSNNEFVDMSSNSPVEQRRKRSNSSIKKITFSPLTLLFEAIGERCITEVRSILASEPGLDVNSFNANGQSLLHVAANVGVLECVYLLLENGASVELKDSQGWTPVHYAIRGGYWKCAILLVEAGANMAEYAQKRKDELIRVLEMSKSCYITSEVYV